MQAETTPALLLSSLLDSLRFHKRISYLQHVRLSGGLGCALTLTIPPCKPIGTTLDMLTSELGCTASIKDRQARDRIIDLITSAIGRLKLYKETPPNGLMVFCGSDFGNNCDHKIAVHIVPPKPTRLCLYAIDAKFILENIKAEMQDEEPPVGLIVIQRDRAQLAILKNNRAVDVIHEFQFQTNARKTRGGASSIRFARLRYSRRILDLKAKAELYFLREGICHLKALIVTTSPLYEQKLLETGFFDPRLQEKIIAVNKIETPQQNTLQEAVRLAERLIQGVSSFKQKELMEDFTREIEGNTGMAVYGLTETIKQLQQKNVRILLISQGFLDNLVEDGERTPSVPSSHPFCRSTPRFPPPRSAVSPTARPVPVPVLLPSPAPPLQLIPDSTPDSLRFWTRFGGVAALLNRAPLGPADWAEHGTAATTPGDC